MTDLGSAARGLAAALRTPLAVRGRALDALLTVPTGAAGPADPATPARAGRATDAAFAALRQLRRVPGWRNTCLYRAVAECLVLRGLGLPAVLRLGVARVGGAVAAHAWVDCPGHRCRATDGGGANVYAPLARAPLARAADRLTGATPA